MSRILLDTSAYSAFMENHPDILREMGRADTVAITTVTLGELYVGFARGSREQANRAKLREFLESPRVDCLPITRTTAERYAVILKDLLTAGLPIPANDLWMAAVAMEHGLTVVTYDRHLERVRQIIVHCYDRMA